MRSLLMRDDESQNKSACGESSYLNGDSLCVAWANSCCCYWSFIGFIRREKIISDALLSTTLLSVFGMGAVIYAPVISNSNVVNHTGNRLSTFGTIGVWLAALWSGIPRLALFFYTAPS